MEFFSKLFEPVKLGHLTLKNRIVMTPMSTRFADSRGKMTDRLIEYYAARASGGAGLITVEHAAIHPQLPHVKNALGIYSDSLIPGLETLTRRIHEKDALAFLQIGLHFRQKVNGFPRFAASVPAPDSPENCMELRIDEIHFLTGLFADAAERAQKAGFDGIEIHACHGSILCEFLSPYWNRRTDEYGGGPSGRFRFPLEVLAGIRKRLGKDYPVVFRISGTEFIPEGFTPEDAIAFSKALENSGVSAISVSGGLTHVDHIAVASSYVPRGIFLPFGKAIKETVSVPVVIANSLTPQLALQAIESGQADLIGLGRPLIVDPEWPHKVEQGRLDELRPCIRCNQGCFGFLRDPSRHGISCMYNPLAGREFESPIREAESKRRVVVIGGGPAGCEVARVSRLRGHEVILFEKTDRLGGQFNLASVAPRKGEFSELVNFYQGELKRLGVDVRLKIEVTPDFLATLSADTYIFANGSTDIRPSIPGANLNHVILSHDVLAGRSTVSRGPVVVIGGGTAGLETADFLSEGGLKITVVEMLDSVGKDIVPGTGVRESLLSRLSDKNVDIRTGCRVMEILEGAVNLSGRPLIGGGTEIRIPANSVVLSLGVKPLDTSAMAQSAGSSVWYQIGDCRNPCNALDAIHEGFALGIKI